MAEGKLYCEHCGEDIHIVPDFEPELERSLELTMNGILEDLDEDFHEEPYEEEDDGRLWEESGQEYDEEPEDTEGQGRPRRKKGRYLLIFLLVTGVLILLAAGMAVWAAYNYNSEEYLVNKAAQYVTAGKYDKAIAYYNRALELDAGNVQLTFELAEVYLMKNNKVEYEYLMREIIKNKNATIEELDSAYSKLIAIYRARGDYQTINDLLLDSKNETLLSTYQGYIAREPEFSVKEGYYTSIQPLKLTVIGTGKIYYTMDGTEPTENSAQYTAPIILENGDYVIKAYFVNENGVSSSVISKEYHIENDEILAPEVNALSGRYVYPIDIEVVDPEDNVYYTTDGSDPTYLSLIYSGPIHMPLGKSTFKFARVVDGVTGNITERNYELVMDTDFTPAQAVDSVVEYVVSTGKIIDGSGRYDESDNKYQYMYQYVTNINEEGFFYVVAEVLSSTDGSTVRTGSNYAVNVHTRERFKLQQDAYDNAVLVAIDTEEESAETEEE